MWQRPMVLSLLGMTVAALAAHINALLMARRRWCLGRCLGEHLGIAATVSVWRKNVDPAPEVARVLYHATGEHLTHFG
jgi:hypothetical protein